MAGLTGGFVRRLMAGLALVAAADMARADVPHMPLALPVPPSTQPPLSSDTRPGT